MRIAANIVGGLLGFLFAAFSLMALLHMAPNPSFPPGSPVDHFMQAFGPTGYMTMVEIFELTGGLLVIIPKTRNLGLLVLGPIIINILAFHILVMNWAGLNGIHAFIVIAALFLLWTERKAFAGLIH
jgi:putative oxidoreductase